MKFKIDSPSVKRNTIGVIDRKIGVYSEYMERDKRLYVDLTIKERDSWRRFLPFLRKISPEDALEMFKWNYSSLFKYRVLHLEALRRKIDISIRICADIFLDDEDIDAIYVDDKYDIPLRKDS